MLSTIRQNPVMRCDSVLPLLEGPAIFNLPREDPSTPFAVVVEQNQKRVGLMVTRLIGSRKSSSSPSTGWSSKPDRSRGRRSATTAA